MKVYVMTDMEGVAGILDSENWCRPPDAAGLGGRYYSLGKELLTQEVYAAVEGLYAAGATDVVVADGHGAGGIHPLSLDPRARLMRGWPRGWPLELDGTYDAVIWVGQHAKADTTHAHLCHTQSFRYLDESINDVSIGEFGQFALCAGELGIPAIFLSGDRAACREAGELAPGIVTVEVKEGLQPDGGAGLDAAAYGRHNRHAIHLHPEMARRAIRAGAEGALEALRRDRTVYSRVRLEPPYTRVTILRPLEEGGEWQISRVEHPSSVAGVLNRPMQLEPYRL